MENIIISDEIDLEKIVSSGQCFRPRQVSLDTYLFITDNHYLYIKDLGGKDTKWEFQISCNREEFNEIWSPYFDLDTKYSKARKAIPKEDAFMVKAGKLGKGIRILRQSPFETLISFIISQRKNIPAIRKSVEKLCQLYG